MRKICVAYSEIILSAKFYSIVQPVYDRHWSRGVIGRFHCEYLYIYIYYIQWNYIIISSLVASRVPSRPSWWIINVKKKLNTKSVVRLARVIPAAIIACVKASPRCCAAIVFHRRFTDETRLTFSPVYYFFRRQKFNNVLFHLKWYLCLIDRIVSNSPLYPGEKSSNTSRGRGPNNFGP